MRVAIAQETLRHYRVPFFEALRVQLADEGIDLELYVGQPSLIELAKQDTADIAWARRSTNRRLVLGSRSLVWQSCLRDLRGADLVIVEQASRMLLNYVLLAWRRVGGPRVAFWGHGRNLASAEASRIAETIKRMVSTDVDWWFAYNDLSARIVEQMGFPKSRITSVMNAKDTSELIAWRQGFTQEEIDDAAAAAGLQGRNVGVFVGSLYPAKRLDLLVAASKQVHDAVGDFELLVIGAGSEADYVRFEAGEHPWIRYVGPKRGIDLARLVAASKLMLIPSFVGLVVIDSFALGTPVVTYSGLDHPPEVDYVVHGENGWLVPSESSMDLVSPYADAVARLISDDDLRCRLADGCRRSAETYTLENMVTRFTDGIRRALGA